MRWLRLTEAPLSIFKVLISLTLVLRLCANSRYSALTSSQQLTDSSQVATKKCAQELETGRDKTKQLLAKYVALKDSVEHKAAQNYASGTTEDDYVVVLIDAHSHEVYLSLVDCERRLTRWYSF